MKFILSLVILAATALIILHPVFGFDISTNAQSTSSTAETLNRTLIASSSSSSSTGSSKSSKSTGKPTPTDSITPEPTKSEEQKVLDVIKEKVATQVAQLTKTSSKVVAGTITKKEDSHIMITTQDNSVIQGNIENNVTQWLSTSNGKELSYADIKVGDYIILDGISIDGSISINIGYKDSYFKVGHGIVSTVDLDKNSFSLTAQDQNSIDFTFDKSTKILIYDIKSKELIKAKSDKILVGDTIHFVQSKKGSATILSKIVIIPQELFIKKSF